MKKVLAIFMAVVMLLTLVPTMVFAEDDALKFLEYYQIEGDKVLITGNKNDPVNLVIPSEIDGMPVISIESNAFSGCSSLQSITIPDSVTKIDGNAFSGCSSLQKIIIPDSVTEIGWDAFEGCSSLQSITIPDSVTSIGSNAFSGCSSLLSIIVSENNELFCSVDGILFNADKTELIRYPEAKTDTSYTIPSFTIRVDYGAFNGCSSLQSVTIPDTVASIGSFNGCSSLSSIIVSENNEYYSSVDGVLFSKDMTELIEFPKGRTDTSYKIPDFVVSIKENAFEGCSSLQSLTIPDSVTSIGSNAFSGCSSLQSITIPDSVASIGSRAFSGCSNLSSITIPDSVTDIYDYVFSGCSSLQSVTIPDSVININGGAFFECSSLKSIKIPESVTSIYGDTFTGCSSLESIKIPKAVNSINGSAFAGCSSLSVIDVDEDNENYTSFDGVLYSKDKTVLVAYPGAKSNTYDIPDSTITIGINAFASCKNLSSVTIPKSVTSISSGAFYKCVELSNIVIPDSVTSIDYSAFEGCSNLSSITIADSVTNIGMNVFFDTAYYNDESNWENGVLYIDNYLIEAKDDISGNYTVKDGTYSIAMRAFENCNLLEGIEIPDSVSIIGDYAFYCCNNLSSITINGTISSFGGGAFSDTAYFNNESNWENDLLYIDEHLIGAKEGISGKCTIKDGTKTVANYVFMDCWSLENVEIPNSVTNLGEGLFYRCGAIKNIVLPDSITIIENSLFFQCTGLETIVVPDSVTSIGRLAFYETNLSSVVIPVSVTSIDDSAFEYDPIKKVYYSGTEEQWNAIDIGENNTPLFDAAIVFNYVSGVTPEYETGDINGDGKITASDARSVLRIATKLDNIEDYNTDMSIIDVNGDGKITAVDARKILRVATKLDKGFEEEEVFVLPKDFYELDSKYSSEEFLAEKSEEAGCQLQKIYSDEAIRIATDYLGGTHSCVEGVLPNGEIALYDLERERVISKDGSWYNFNGTKMAPCENCGATMGYGSDMCFGWCDVHIEMAG